jgi:hypothetical protein
MEDPDSDEPPPEGIDSVALLVEAAGNGDAAGVAEALAQGLFSTDCVQGLSALHCGARSGSKEVVDRLLNYALMHGGREQVGWRGLGTQELCADLVPVRLPGDSLFSCKHGPSALGSRLSMLHRRHG